MAARVADREKALVWTPNWPPAASDSKKAEEILDNLSSLGYYALVRQIRWRALNAEGLEP
jgi:hypothetical protein